MFKFQNKGISLIGMVITIVVVGLVVGGLYFYLQRKMPENLSALQGQEQQQEEEVVMKEENGGELADKQETQKTVKCEFPEEVNGFSRGDFIAEFSSDDFGGPTEIEAGVSVMYYDLVMITFIKCHNNIDAEKNVNSLIEGEEYNNCKLDDIEGKCLSKKIGNEVITDTIIWQEEKTVKSIILWENKNQGESFDDTKKRAREHLKSFVIELKNCEL